MITDQAPTGSQQTSPVLEPAKDAFWQKYSSRFELPLSSAVSLALHGLLIAVLLLAGIMLVRSQADSKPLPVEPLQIGDASGEHDQKDGDLRPAPKEQIGDRQSPLPPVPPLPAGAERLNQPTLPPEPPAVFTNPAARILEAAEGASADLNQATENLKNHIRREQERGAVSSGGKPGQGQGPPGARGLEEGQKRTPGSSNPSQRLDQQRIERRDRWVMVFQTWDGNDYLRQLEALGAILAIPQPDNRFLIIRDLKQKPAQGRIEDVAEIQRVFWIDDKPDSVRALAGALQLREIPARIVAFFPEQLEADLLRKELRFRNRREEGIRKTYFRVERRGNSYEPRVVDQLLRDAKSSR
jgi:hypothetical protein